MASLSLRHVDKVYPNANVNPSNKTSMNLKIVDGGVLAVDDFNLEIEDKEFIVLVGPSGCGKSTALRMIAGLEKITKGEIYIGDVLVNDLEPRDRDIAMVFQNYALYPHMTVRQNISFPLKLRRLPKDEMDRLVNQAADILGITEYLERKPKALSGGQRQRVAIGRAIVREPRLLLMDEPLSNLDAKLRNQMRAEIIKLRQRINSTFVYVTHDQLEAMTLATRVCLIEKGVLQQYDAPLVVYNRPNNLFVADFVGNPTMNFIPAKATIENSKKAKLSFLDLDVEFDAEDELTLSSDDVIIGIRPEFLPISEKGKIKGLAYSTLPAGMETTVKIRINDTILSSVVFGSIDYVVDEEINFDIAGKGIILFDAKTGQKVSLGSIKVK